MAESIFAHARVIAAEPAASGAVAPSRLLATVRDSIGSEFACKAARFIGADEWRTQSAIDMLALAVLRHLAHRSAGADGAAQVFAELHSPRIDRDLLGTVNQLLADEPAELGGGLHAAREAAQEMLGRRTGSVVFTVASTSGLPVDATWQLLALATPLVYAALRDHVRARGLDAEALRNRLASEYAQGRSKRRRRRRFEVDIATKQAPPFIREARAHSADALARLDRHKLMRGGIVAAGAFVAGALWLGGDPTTEAVSAGSGRATRLAEYADGPVYGSRHSAGLDGLVAFLSNSESKFEYVFVLDAVQFEPASATLKSASNAQLGQLARVLADFPEARVTIEAYADRAPDGAQWHTRSESRALAVRAAIAALGVLPSRIRYAAISGTTRAGSGIEVRIARG